MINKIYNQDCIVGMEEYVKTDSIDLVIADSPFALEANTNKIESLYNRDSSKVISAYVEIPEKEYMKFSIDWIQQVNRVLRPGGSAYIISGYTNLRQILIALNETNLQIINHLIWKYNFGIYTKTKYVSSHYHILYCVKPPISKKTFNTYSRFDKDSLMENGNKANYSDREDVWMINRDYYPNEMKTKNRLPVELIGKVVDYSSNKGDTILDPFLGSATTTIIAYASERNFIGFEISEEVFNFAKERLEDLHEM